MIVLQSVWLQIGSVGCWGDGAVPQTHCHEKVNQLRPRVSDRREREVLTVRSAIAAPPHRRSDLHRRFRIEFTFEKATALPACSTATVFLSRGTTTYTTNLVNVSGGVAGNALCAAAGYCTRVPEELFPAVFPVRLKETRIAINCRISRDAKGQYEPKVRLVPKSQPDARSSHARTQ